jgi:hypothetical protein
MTDRASGPPLYAPMTENSAGKENVVTLPWGGFFNSLFEGDAGTQWTPVFTSLTEAGGAAAISASYHRINQNMVYWTIVIDPATSVSATAGTTYASGFPLSFTLDSFCVAVSGGLGALPGHVVASNNRIYIPALSAVTVPVTICGVALAR